MKHLRAKRIDRSDLLESPIFWGVYYYDHQFYEDLEAFGISQSDFDAIRHELKEITDTEPGRFACYSLTLPLSGRCSVSVEFELCPGDAGTAFYIQHADWRKRLLLCRMPSSLDMPPFRWDEVVLLTSAICETSRASALHRAALPLLFPGVWLTPHDDPDRVHLHLHSAWEGLEAAKPAAIDDWVSTMTKHQLVSETVHFIDRRGTQIIDRYENRAWRYDERLGWVNNSWSRRNPDHSAPSFFQKVKEFFSVIEGV
jgi:hypothetical protein